MAGTIEKFYMEEIELVSKDPMEIFKSWLLAAKEEKANVSPEIMTLSTVDVNGNPRSRTVVLRGYDEHGFKVYTDSRSRKAEEMEVSKPRAWVQVLSSVRKFLAPCFGNLQEKNPHASIVLVWAFHDKFNNLGHKQVRAEGIMERLPLEEQEAYFNGEPLSAKIRAAVCVQSRIIDDRKLLLDECQKLLEKVQAGGPTIQKPDNFQGYRLVPTAMEFYQGTRDTINDRIRFRLESNSNPNDLPKGTYAGENGWVYERLEP